MLQDTKKESSLPRGTYCTDAAATHTVSTGDAYFGYGIFGYYTCEIDAFRARKWLLDRHCANISVESYDAASPVTPGMHPKIAAHQAGLI